MRISRVATSLPDAGYLMGRGLDREGRGHRDIEISVVMPCLNEEDSVASTVREALEGMMRAGLNGEVVVVDNGSTDRSVTRALAAGARVIHESRRGYGSACLRGLNEARGRLVVLGDSDGTYDFREVPRFVGALKGEIDVVLGNRLHGGMEGGAMPWLHRHVGNPGLTGILNLLHGANVSDAHCGLRAIRRSVLADLELQADGMEFASEFVISAVTHGLRLAELPIAYRRRLGGLPKLRTWSDGWRHLRLIFAMWFAAHSKELSVAPTLNLSLVAATEGIGEQDR